MKTALFVLGIFVFAVLRAALDDTPGLSKSLAALVDVASCGPIPPPPGGCKV